VRGRAGVRKVRAFICFASETTKTNRSNSLFQFRAESEDEMLGCPVQVTTANVCVQIQFHVFLALDLQESGQPYDSGTDAPVASDHEAWGG
jgi:hypothetical protein